MYHEDLEKRGGVWWRPGATCHNSVTVTKREHFLKSPRFSGFK